MFRCKVDFNEFSIILSILNTSGLIYSLGSFAMSVKGPKVLAKGTKYRDHQG